MPTAPAIGEVDPSVTVARNFGEHRLLLRTPAIAQSTSFFAGSFLIVTNFERRATLSVDALPLSRRPGWKIGLPSGKSFSLASTWLLLRMKRPAPSVTRHPRV